MSRIAIVHFVNYKRGTQSRAAMRGVMLYVMQEKKTAWEGGPLVSGIKCQPQSVYDDFLNTKLLYHKDGGVMFYHMVQSFPKGAAVDPRPVPLIPAVAGLTAVGTLMDEDEDAEEKRRRMEAKIAAENFGAAIGFAAGTAMAVKEKLDEHAAQEKQKKQQHEQTMGELG